MIKRLCLTFLICMFTYSVNAQTWTSSDYGTHYTKDSLEIRERIIDCMQKYSVKSVSRRQLANILDLSAMEAVKLDLELPTMLAIIATETNFKPYAVSCAGAKHGRGLMQVSEIALLDYNKSNGTKYAPKDLFDIEINIRIGFWVYLQNAKYGLNKYDTIRMVSAYNMGIGSVKRGKINYKYVNKVIAFKNEYFSCWDK